ncbi:unnamed protein product, partial [Ectocarpus sp. 12 AP-2014]
MLTGAGLSRRSWRLVGRVHGNGASLAAPATAANRLAHHDGGSSDNSKRTCRGDPRPLQHLLQSQTLHVPALQQRGHRSSSATRLGGDGGTIGVAAFGGGRGLDLSAGWREAASAGETVGARRRASGGAKEARRCRGGARGNGSPQGGRVEAPRAAAVRRLAEEGRAIPPAAGLAEVQDSPGGRAGPPNRPPGEERDSLRGARSRRRGSGHQVRREGRRGRYRLGDGAQRAIQ